MLPLAATTPQVAPFCDLDGSPDERERVGVVEQQVSGGALMNRPGGALRHLQHGHGQHGESREGQPPGRSGSRCGASE
jgi:hypothetical protein